MKFKLRVAVQRDGRVAYYTHGFIARQMCLAGVASRRGQTAIELAPSLPGEREDVQSLAMFAAAKPVLHCYGAHTSPNQDRKTYAPCFFRAHTGSVGGTRRVYMEHSNEKQPPEAEE